MKDTFSSKRNIFLPGEDFFGPSQRGEYRCKNLKITVLYQPNSNKDVLRRMIVYHPYKIQLRMPREIVFTGAFKNT
jgi:hypothetical protein